MRWNEVVQQTTQRKARALWSRFLGDLMTGRRIEFNPPVFRKLADLSYQLYLAPSDSARRDIGRNFLGQTGDRAPADPITDEETLLRSTFFTFDGQPWTVADFKRELASHPLVYRNKALDPKAFDSEFKAAVADFLRDHTLTRQAYKRRLQNRPEVRKAETLWRDAMVAGYQRDQILKDLARRNGLEGQSGKLKAVYEAYVDSLREAHRDEIRIDTEALAAIRVSNTDMVAMKPGVPYPMAMPGFPMLITKNP
jgi:hypothetical protein